MPIFIDSLSDSFILSNSSQFICIEFLSFQFCFKSSLYFHCHFTNFWHISLNKYDCHTALICHTANMLYRHIDQTFLHTFCKTKLPAIHTLHVNAKFMLEANMLTKFGIYSMYTKYFMGLYGKCIHIYVPHMKSLQLTM